MSGEQIYLAARDCARGDQARDLTSPISWQSKLSLIDRLRADHAARVSAKAASAMEQGKSP